MNSVRFNILIRSLRSDKHAFEELFDFYFDRIVNHVSRKYRRGFGEDVAQDFFVKIMGMTVKQYIIYPTSWVYKVCDNIAIDYIADNPFFEELTGNETAELCLPVEDQLHLFLKLNEIDLTERNIIYLHIWEGYSLNEISGILDISYGATRKKYSRTLKKLKQHLNE